MPPELDTLPSPPAPAPDVTEESDAVSTRSSDPTETGGPTPAKAPDAAVLKPGGKILPLSLIPKKPVSRFQQRISDLVAARNATDGENRALREQLSRLTGGGGVTGKVGPAAEVSDDPNAPLTPENFETYAEYVAALVNRTIEKREATQQSERGEQAMANHRQQRMAAFQEAAAPMMTQYGEDFMEAISDPTLPVSEPMADAVLELEDIGPYLMLYLANNRQESAQIARLNPRAATVAIGRLAAKLDSELKSGGDGSGATPAAVAPTATVEVNRPGGMASAPPAVKPVPVPRGSSPASITGQPNDKMSMPEWLAAERHRLREKYGNQARFYGG